jgi:hypothetical protein
MNVKRLAEFLKFLAEVFGATLLFMLVAVALIVAGDFIRSRYAAPRAAPACVPETTKFINTRSPVWL